MPLPFLCKALYFSFLDDKSTIITSDIKIPRSLIANMNEVQNLSIDTNGVEVSLPIADYDSAYMGTQNCLLLSKDKTDEILIYHINNYQFKGGYMTIKANNTPYIINKTQVTTDNQYYIIKNQIPKDAISTFIEWGYAHDSICKEDGTLNITEEQNTDIYQTCYNGKCEIVNKRFKLHFDVADTKTNSEILSENVMYWVYVYVEPRDYYRYSNGEQSTKLMPTYFGDYTAPNSYTTSGVQLPYTIMCYPVMNPDTPYSIVGLGVDGFYAFRELNNDTSYIYSLKISSTPPTQRFNIAVDDYNHRIVLGATNLDYPDVNGYVIEEFSTSVGDFTYIGGLLILVNVKGKPYVTTPITINELQQYGYPKGTKPNQIVATNDFKSINNPYISLHTTKLRLTNSVGGLYEYNPIDLGLFNELKFLIYDPLLIDNNSIFICVDTSTLQNARLTKFTTESYNGFLSSSNTNMIYSTDLLAQYVANNKNAYDSFYMKTNYNTMRGIANGIMNIGLGAWGASMNPMVGQQIISGIQMAGGLSNALWAASDNAIQKTLFENSMEDLSEARDNLNYMANSTFMGLMIKGVGYFLEIVTISNYAKDVLYREFIDKGIKLNKYIKDTDAFKYLSITDKPFDKTTYKFVKASGNLKGNKLYNTKQLLTYKNYLQNGIQLIKTNDIVVSDEPTNQDNVLQNINEEEIN